MAYWPFLRWRGGNIGPSITLSGLFFFCKSAPSVTPRLPLSSRGVVLSGELILPEISTLIPEILAAIALAISWMMSVRESTAARF